MKKYILFDHDGVLVDTEYWYYTANKRVLTEMGIELMMEQYLEIMIQGRSCLDLIATKGADKEKVTQARERRNQYYQNYLKKENIEIPGVEKVLKELSLNYKMAVITTSKKQDFELIHKDRNIVSYMDFVLVREDGTFQNRAKVVDSLPGYMSVMAGCRPNPALRAKLAMRL